jgi:rubredoxin/uncharacterized membrane protein
MANWKCSVCGYETSSNHAPDQCPVCSAEKTKFNKIETAAPTPESSQADAQNRWRCLVCGYIHTGPEPPETCPVCGADKSQFVLVEAETASAAAKPAKPQTTQKKSSTAATLVHPQQTVSRSTHSIFQLSARIKFITRLHGHPIAVHIPNGVLPLSFLFTLIAVAFNSEAFATAAAYNIAFVSLSMPIVVITGFIDWYNRFNARWAKIFTIKFSCGIVVSTLSLIIALMWFIQPTIYQVFSARLMIFMALNVINLITAAAAGYYGGKLIFNQGSSHS